MRLGDQPGFADPRLTRDEDDASLPFHGLPPAAQHQLQFLLASDQRRQPRLMLRLEATLDRACTHHLPCLHSLDETFELHHAQIAVLEHAPLRLRARSQNMTVSWRRSALSRDGGSALARA